MKNKKNIKSIRFKKLETKNLEKIKSKNIKNLLNA